MKFWKILLTGVEQLPTPPLPPEKEEEEVEENEVSENNISPERLKDIEKSREKYKREAREEGADFVRKRDEQGKFKGTEWKFTEEQIEAARKEMEEDLSSRVPHAPEDSLIKENEVPKEEAQPKKETIKAGVVDVTYDIKSRARDKALASLNESRKSLKGFSGFAKKIWKHNLFYDFYLIRETYKEEERIKQEQDMPNTDAILDRFMSEYEEAIHEDAGENKYFKELTEEEEDELKEKIKAVVLDFAKGEIDEASFMEEKARLVFEYRNFANKDVPIYADNLIDIARHIQAKYEHQEGLDALDLDLEIILGEARGGARTEAQLTATDKIVEKIKKTKFGSMANEATIATAVSILYSTTRGPKGLVRRLASSKIAAMSTFGGTALLAGGIAGLNEKFRLKVERSQHIREKAQGKDFDKEDARRAEMDKFAYETRTASSLIENLESYLDKDNFYGKDLLDAVGELAEAEARIRVSDREKIDLISYSSEDEIDQERLRLDIARAKLKVYLRKFDKEGDFAEESSATYKDFDTLLENCINVKTSALREGEKGMDSLDKEFNKFKRKKVAKAVLKGSIIGGAIGMAAQEIVAEVSKGQQGITEGLRGEVNESRNLTPLEALRQWFNTPSPESSTEVFEASEFNETNIDNAIYKMPTGFVIQEADSGAVNLVKRGEVVVEGLKFYPDGTLTNESFEKMEEAGFDMRVDTRFIEEEVVSDTEGTTGEDGASNRGSIVTKVSPEEFIEKNQDDFIGVHRELWYNNDTPSIFENNELGLHWGGEGGTGIDIDGNYVFDVNNMSSEGSFSESLSVDAKQAIEEGKLKMLLSMSKDTQNFAWSVPINENGQAIIDPNSELGKIFFSSNENGEAVFLGSFAEVAEVSDAEDGVENVKLLATLKGEGIEDVDIVESVPGTEDPEVGGGNNEEPETKLRQVTEYEMDYSITEEIPLEDSTMEAPPVIPLIPRDPLEKMKEKQDSTTEQEDVEPRPEFSGDSNEEEEGTEPESINEIAEEEEKHEQEKVLHNILEISGKEEIKKELEEKLKTYKERMSERKQWIDRKGGNPNRLFEDAYFKTVLIEELLDRRTADTKSVEKSLRQEYGDKFNEKKFNSAVKFLREFIDKTDK